MISGQNGDSVNVIGEVSDLESNRYPQSSSPDNSKRRSTQPGTMEYNHHIQMSNVDDISKQLDDMKENLFKTSVRCHMLEVDLATQFSPYMVDTLRNVKQECEKCTLKMEHDERCKADSTSKPGSEAVPNKES